MLDKFLADKRVLLFWMSLCITVGGWMITVKTWHDALAISAIGGLLILLGNNVLANAIKNIGLLGKGGTNGSTPNPNEPKT